MLRLILSIAFIAGLNICNAQTDTFQIKLEASSFAEKLAETPEAQLLDVRTPQEYLKGHIPKSINYNINGDDFEQLVSTLNKAKPLFIYCFSGGRSAQAVKKLRSMGFEQVYELQDGFMSWEAVDLPEIKDSIRNTHQRLTIKEFNSLILSSDKPVLVDFYADWCTPCKEIKPFLDDIAKEMGNQIDFVRINADDHPEICAAYGVNTLPVLQLYKNDKLLWFRRGYINKKRIIAQIKKAL